MGFANCVFRFAQFVSELSVTNEPSQPEPKKDGRAKRNSMCRARSVRCVGRSRRLVASWFSGMGLNGGARAGRPQGRPAVFCGWVRPQCMLDFCVLYYPVSLALVPRLGSKGGRAGALPGVGWGDVPARAARAVTKEVP
jgi:hypothetical protein